MSDEAMREQRQQLFDILTFGKSDAELVVELEALIEKRVAAAATVVHAPQPASYPIACGCCDGKLESDADKEWHGLGNCVPICERCEGSGIEPPPLVVDAALAASVQQERERCIVAARDSILEARRGTRWGQYDAADVEAAIRGGAK
jgi:hypothetical protein